MLRRLGESVRRVIKGWRRRHWDWHPYEDPPDSIIIRVGGSYPPFRRTLRSARIFVRSSWRGALLALLGMVISAIVGAVVTKVLF